jgi:hypothetical protein
MTPNHENYDNNLNSSKGHEGFVFFFYVDLCGPKQLLNLL